MTRPQFTIRTMLVSVSYFAVSFGCFRAAFALKDARGWMGFFSIVLGLAGIVGFGAGIGALFKRQLLGAVIAVVVAYAVPIVFDILMYLISN